MDAIILTAGKATRLYPLTKSIPKPLMPIAGSPLICHILEALSESITQVIIVIGHKADLVKETISQLSYPFKIIWVIQQEQQGTGHAVKICENYIDSNSFYMMYGDIFTSQQVINDIILLGQSNDQKLGVFSAKKVDNPEKYGCLEIRNGHLVKIYEKHPQPPSSYINAGMMVLPSSIFDYLANTPKSSRGEIEITDSINHLIRDGYSFSVYHIKDHWIDIGYPWDVLEANEIGMKSQKYPEFTSPSSVTIEGPCKISKNVTLRSGTFIQGPVVIEEDVVVGPNCFLRPGTYLGKNVRIGNAVEIKNSLILDNTIIGHLSYVGDSIIGRNCNFGAGTKAANLRLDKKDIYMTVKGERISSGRRKLGVFLGDNVNTGINVSLMPGITIGENSYIGAHTLVNQDIASNMLFYYDPKEGLVQKPLQ
ncbi:MAG: bifunctional sugar-1-phosphate nucleotidylyltransferase/acetyltransferase [Promethearchaeota archaeon]